jgi:GTPase SAR1 family protein
MAEMDPKYVSETKSESNVQYSDQSDLDDLSEDQDATPIEPEVEWETLKSRVDEEYHQIIPDEVKDIISSCPIYRVLLLGKKGAGKSTLSSGVLGLSYKVPHPTPANTVWHQLPKGALNKDLVLHDTGGIGNDEVDPSMELEQVKNFIKSKESGQIGDQIHAVWYLIDCSAKPSVQQSDRDFVSGKLLDIGEVPVFVVFAKYDLLVERLRRKAEPEITTEQVEKKAENYFKFKIEAEVKKSISDLSRFSFCRVGFMDNGEEYTPSYQAKDGE